MFVSQTVSLLCMLQATSGKSFDYAVLERVLTENVTLEGLTKDQLVCSFVTQLLSGVVLCVCVLWC